jgi:hypothetical protein
MRRSLPLVDLAAIDFLVRVCKPWVVNNVSKQKRNKNLASIARVCEPVSGKGAAHALGAAPRGTCAGMLSVLLDDVLLHYRYAADADCVGIALIVGTTMPVMRISVMVAVCNLFQRLMITGFSPLKRKRVALSTAPLPLSLDVIVTLLSMYVCDVQGASHTLAARVFMREADADEAAATGGGDDGDGDDDDHNNNNGEKNGHPPQRFPSLTTPQWSHYAVIFFTPLMLWGRRPCTKLLPHVTLSSSPAWHASAAVLQLCHVTVPHHWHLLCAGLTWSV